MKPESKDPSMLRLIPVLLPTEDKNVLLYTSPNGKINLVQSGQKVLLGTNAKNQNLYLCSTLPIKEGDWRIGGNPCKITKHKSIDDKYVENVNRHETYSKHGFKRIEFTTDPKLIADGVGKIDGETIVWIETKTGIGEIKNITHGNFLFEYCKRYNQKDDQKGVDPNNGVWVRASERLPIGEAGTIYAVRMWAHRESGDVNAYCEMCLLENGNVRIDNDEIPGHYAILEHYDWLDESIQSNAGGFSLDDINTAINMARKVRDSENSTYSNEEIIKSLTKEQPKGDIVIELNDGNLIFK